MNIGVFPGTFDPFTIGHKDIVDRALLMFDKVIVMVGINSSKPPVFEALSRRTNIRDIFRTYDNVQVEEYEGLTTDFCKMHNVTFIIRGCRNATDFAYEQNLAHVNKELFGIDSVFFVTDPSLQHISSSLVRELRRFGKDYKQFLP